jgi:hypothetical protein
MRIFEKKWMSIELKFDVKIETTKMYSLNFANRKFVDEIFDKLHVQNRMKYINQFISHDYFVFAIWKTIFESNDLKRKNRIVVNIRELNKIILIDFYFMFFQSNIIVAMFECKFISIFDATNFFHQWLIKFVDRHKFIVVFHKKQKQFNVAIMKFKNSFSYVQRRIDSIFRNFREFVRVYVNDIVVFFNIFEKHMIHFHSIFQRFNFYEINLSFKKFFLNYFTIALFDQKIDAFELIIATKKFETIIKLNFFYILKNFEIYLKFTKWLRKFITFYAQKIDALQRCKNFFYVNRYLTKKSFAKFIRKKQ